MIIKLTPLEVLINYIALSRFCKYYQHLNIFIFSAQPPGVPEVCRKSLVSCPATGGLELYLLGKNFLKETRVVFCHRTDRTTWEEEVIPDKEFLQQVRVCLLTVFIQHTSFFKLLSFVTILVYVKIRLRACH